MKGSVDVDVKAFESELRQTVRGEGRFSEGDRALYATDSSNYRQIPIGVVVPRDRADVIATVAACRKFGAFTLAEFFKKFAPDHSIHRLKRKALVYGHCHHKAIMKVECDPELFDRLGLDFDIIDSGCCGMAGGFGFEKDHYDVSVGCGERALLPMVRNAGKETLIIADGFSCREQIRQIT